MKDKNYPLDNNTVSLEELTNQANKIIETLENEKDLSRSVESYQEPVSYTHLTLPTILLV